jgi:hypothetical protein
MKKYVKHIATLVLLSSISLLMYGQTELTYRYETKARQDTSFYTSVAFAQVKHSRLVDMGVDGIVLWGTNSAVSHLQVQYLTVKPRIQKVELPEEIKEYYKLSGLTFGSVSITGDTAIVVLNESFILKLCKDNEKHYQLIDYIDAFPILHNPIKKLYFYGGNYYAVVQEQVEAKNPQSDLFTLNVYQINPINQEVKNLWQRYFLKRFTRNIFFENYFFQDSMFHYFNPLTYEVDRLCLTSPKELEQIDFSKEHYFQKSEEKVLMLQEWGNHESNIKQFINITKEDLVKDYIKLIYPCKEGYLIWKTNYPEKKKYRLDWVSKDLKHIRRNIKHPFAYTAKDSTPIGSFNHFPVTPSGNYITMLGNKLVVGVNHSGVEYNTETKHKDIWKEFYKTIGRDCVGPYTMDYFMFEYRIKDTGKL